MGRHYFIESILKGFGTRGGAVLCCVQNQNKVQGSGTKAVEENDRERERTSMWKFLRSERLILEKIEDRKWQEFEKLSG